MFDFEHALIQAHKEWYEKQKREEVVKLLLDLIMISEKQD